MLRFLTRHLLLVVLVLLFGSPAIAQRDRDTYSGGSQTFEINGQVRLTDTGASAQRVQVRLERFSGGIIDQIPTDNQGRFRFPNLQRGYYKVIINAPGYRPVQQDADLQVLFRIYLSFELIPDHSNNSTGLPPLGGEVIDARVSPAAREQFDSARSELVRKNYPEAISHLEKAIEVYPEFFEANLLLGTAQMDTREWNKAEKALLRALEIKPENAPALLSLGEVYWRQKRYQDAEQTLQEGLKLDDKAWQGYFTLGRLYWDMGDVAKAGPPIGKTLQLKPELAEAHLLAGNILLRVGQNERALIEYHEYLRLAPKGDFAPQVQDLIKKVEKTAQRQKQ
jgi:tetratricopeptide (TPR) repeat protein